MTTQTIREKLHNYLEIADDKKVEALYSILGEAMEESTIDYTPEMKRELDRRFQAYQQGESKAVTEAEGKERIAALEFITRTGSMATAGAKKN